MPTEAQGGKNAKEYLASDASAESYTDEDRNRRPIGGMKALFKNGDSFHGHSAACA
jgi:hypothetical protein